MATGDRLNHYWETAHIQTTDGYDTTLLIINPDNSVNGMMFIEGWVVAYKNGQTYCRVKKMVTHGEIDSGGFVDAAGVSVGTVYETLSGMTWTADIQSNGSGGIGIRVNGNGDTVDWYGSLTITLIEVPISGA